MSAIANAEAMQLTQLIQETINEQTDTKTQHPNNDDEGSMYARSDGQPEQRCENTAATSTSCVQNACKSSSSVCVECGVSNKLRNRFDLKLEMGTSSQQAVGAIKWTVSPVECSPSPSSSDDEKRVAKESASHDSGFSSDDNSPKRSPPQRTKLERSITLPSALRAPTRTRSQKSVHFADSLGLDLEQKNFFDEDDWCEKPHSHSYPTFSVLKSCEEADQRYASKLTALSLVPINFRIHSEAEMMHLTHTKCVCLRSLSICDMNVTGLIDVLNLAFDKQVCVRYSTNGWISFAEASAIYVSAHGNDGAVDSFSFSIELPKNLPLGTSCYFCIRYTVNGISYWDNNNNANFELQCTAKETETKKEKALRKSKKEPLFGITDDCSDDYDIDLRPVWPEYFPEVVFPTFKAGGWRHREQTSNCYQEPRFY